MVLTKEQARALYEAMKNLNDVEASFRFVVKHADGMNIVVEENPETWAVSVKIDEGSTETIVEFYESQPAFAAAYSAS
ncbi:hypothetical protein [Burkholderia gladioli]|uniref:hypothetical protein n=1 Tax=Burkholderia gladioli TaxID=28095 RepID=UPI00163E1237|nr:hypothetical protein [Burkholderia gladioli]